MISFIPSKNSPPSKRAVLCFLLLALSACTNSSFFDRNLEIKDQSWSNTDIKVFSVPISDSLSSYTLYLNSRHGLQYPFSDLALSVQMIRPDKQEKTYRLTLQLAEPDGRWKGIGSGNIFQNQVLILENYHFTDTGVYTFNIKPIMNLNPLLGIINIGLRVDKDL